MTLSWPWWPLTPYSEDSICTQVTRRVVLWLDIKGCLWFIKTHQMCILRTLYHIVLSLLVSYSLLHQEVTILLSFCLTGEPLWFSLAFYWYDHTSLQSCRYLELVTSQPYLHALSGWLHVRAWLMHVAHVWPILWPRQCTWHTYNVCKDHHN